ncbi:MAG: glycine cleavage system aminomethyltransferase GcvT [Polyangiales bacterium]
MEAPLRSTALLEEHKALGARLVPFAGWNMPVQYKGVVEEHKAVRERAGLFDVSHMGELELEGPEALPLVESLVSNHISTLADGQAAYCLCCHAKGGVLDDLIVYKRSSDRILIVCNAGNLPKISDYVARAAEGRCGFADVSDATSLIALQGPKAIEVLTAAGGGAFASLKPFHLAHGEVAGLAVEVARTGYTGEDGVEIFVRNEDAPALWRALVAAGAEPCGLGARDTLRLEAKLPLYGNELDEETTPLEAGLDRWVKLDKDFVGRDALAAQKAAGLAKKLVGFEMTGKGIGRHGYPVVIDGQHRGIVTSGSPSPTTGKNIGLAYVPVSHSEIGSTFGVEIRGKVIEAVVVKTPFYKRSR